MKFLPPKLVHIIFKVGLILKGLFALNEVISGIVLIIVDPALLNQMIENAINNPVLLDPSGILMRFISAHVHAFSVDSIQFAIVYLITHGLLKLVIICLLWAKKQWAYPLSIIMFIGFIIYQMYHYMSSHSAMLIFLTVIDVIMIIVTYVEYKNIKEKAKINNLDGIS